LKVGAFAIGSALAGPALAAFGPGGTLLLVAAAQLVAAALGFALTRLRAGRAVPAGAA
jgi:hypothetical protein